MFLRKNWLQVLFPWNSYIVMHCLTAECIECTHINLNGTAYYTPWLSYSLLLSGYYPVQRANVLNTVGNCNTMVLVFLNISNIDKVQ